MKSMPGGLLSLLNSRPITLDKADVFTFTLLNGVVLRYTSYDGNLTLGGHTYLAVNIKRTKTSITLKLAVDTIDVELYDDGTLTVSGTPILQVMRQHAFDGCVVQVDKWYRLPQGTWQGPLVWFKGKFSTINKLDFSGASFSVNSYVSTLSNRKSPPYVIGPGCVHTLFDVGCGLVKASFAVAGVVIAGSTTNKVLATLGQVTDYFTLGTLTFTSGVNSGESRVIRSHISGSPAKLFFALPLLNPPTAGDTFNAYPGCDKLQATCLTKFSNLANFLGFPYVPAPETVL